MKTSWVRPSTFGLVVFAALAVVLAVTKPVSTQGSQRSATVSVNGADAVAGEVLVKFSNELDQDDQQQLDSQLDLDQNEEVGRIGVRRLHSRFFDTEALLAFLRTDARVVYAEPNYILRANLTPNDPSFGVLWGLDNTGQTINSIAGTAGAHISAKLAWDISTGSRATVVGVVDTGIDYTHPDLAANVWSAPTSFTVTIGGTAITCAAGTHGFNAINKTCDPQDDHYHGTHVSGTIGAVGNNGAGVAGVNWTASIMGAKFLDANGSGSTANAINAIEFTIQAKQMFGAGANVRVLNNSWGGGGFSQALLDEINKANTNNILFVAAAGNAGTNNDTTPSYPANYAAPNVVAVAATDNNDGRASFSSYGAKTVHLGAPGVDIASTYPGNQYAYLSGTSMATPHVAGAAALVLSVCALDTAGVKSNLLSNVDPIGSMTGVTTTGGRLNVNKAIRACSAPATPDFSLSATPSSRSVTQGAGTTYTVTVTPSGGFTGAVTLSASGLPAAATATFSPNPTTGASTMTVTTGSTTPTGSYPLTITGTSGTSHTATVTLVVTAPGTQNFTLSASPSSRTISRGARTTYTVTITRSGGFTGSVSLAIGGLPAGATGTFSPNPATAGSSTLTVTTTGSTPAGSFPLTITGTGAGLTRTAPVTLVITGGECNGQC
jgi:subtilisin family serine protease